MLLHEIHIKFLTYSGLDASNYTLARLNNNLMLNFEFLCDSISNLFASMIFWLDASLSQTLSFSYFSSF